MKNEIMEGAPLLWKEPISRAAVLKCFQNSSRWLSVGLLPIGGASRNFGSSMKLNDEECEL